jgi:hypothetical protein
VNKNQAPAIVIIISTMFALCAPDAASAIPSGWPNSISSRYGFHELGQAIRKEKGYPATGTNIEKARYVFSRMNEVAKTYSLTPGTGNPLSNTIIGVCRLGNDPECADSFKYGPGWGNCGEWSYAMSQIFGGAGVISRVAYGDKASGAGSSYSFGGTDTMVLVQERAPDGRISERVFDAFRAAFHSPTNVPTASTLKEWGDRPLTDADKWKDEKTVSWQADERIDKPFIKDAATETVMVTSYPGKLDPTKVNRPDTSKEALEKAEKMANKEKSLQKEREKEKEMTSKAARDQAAKEAMGKEIAAKAARDQAAKEAKTKEMAAKAARDQSNVKPTTPRAVPIQKVITENDVYKGFVRSKDGSYTTLTETYDTTGRLVRVTHTHYDKKGNVTGRNVYPVHQAPPSTGNGGTVQKPTEDIPTRPMTSMNIPHLPKVSGSDVAAGFLGAAAAVAGAATAISDAVGDQGPNMKGGNNSQGTTSGSSRTDCKGGGSGPFGDGCVTPGGTVSTQPYPGQTVVIPGQ